MTKNNIINWPFKINNWHAFTWSFKKFEKWKKEFYKKYKELHWVNFNDDIENPVVRQAIYETLLRVRETWIFLTDSNKTTTDWIVIDNEILKRAMLVNNIVMNIKTKQ